MKIDFPVVIERQTVGVSRRGFGTILIHDPESTLEYTIITPETLNVLEKDSRAYKIAQTLFMQSPSPMEVAVAGGEIDELAGQDFFFLVSTDNSVEAIKEYGKFAGMNNKIYSTTVHDLEDAKALYEVENDNVIATYHNYEEMFLGEALAVEMSYNIGGKTAKFKRLNGISPVTISHTTLKEFEENHIITYVSKMGVSQTSSGRALSGEPIDNMLAEYWIKFRMEEDMMHLALNNAKIPYTNQGIGMMVGTVHSVLVSAVREGMVMEDQFIIDYLRREEVSVNDVANRDYSHIKWAATLAGAIETGTIYGVLTNELVNEVNE